MITITNTPLEGLQILESPLLTDQRGCFKKVFTVEEFSSLHLRIDFKESYYSINRKDVIRGMHFQTPPFDHVKIVYVVFGSILDVCLDIRKDSPTYGQCSATVLSGTDTKYLYIPKGFAHGFKSL